MMRFDEALARVLQDVPRTGVERVDMAHAIGRVLFEDVRAIAAVPPFDRSTMDGYAVRSADLAAVPRTLPVVATASAGGPMPPPLGPGTCHRIFTGAPLPPGA